MKSFRIIENVSLREIYEYMEKLSYPYRYETGYDLWEKSFLRDIDGDGRTLFRNLTTIGAYRDGKMIGFLQYGISAFGFDEKGEISESVSYGIIRNFHYDETCGEAGRELLNEALRKLHEFHTGTVYAFFHYFGMSCYARHGKLFGGFAYIKRLLEETGFSVEHENVFYSCKLSAEDLAESRVKCNWHDRTIGGQQYCDFMMSSRQVGGCEIHFLEEKNIAYLRWIFTNEDIRGKGIGSSCMTALKAELLKRGIEQLDTDTAVNNLAAQHYYEKNHFVKEGLTGSFYQE